MQIPMMRIRPLYDPLQFILLIGLFLIFIMQSKASADVVPTATYIPTMDRKTWVGKIAFAKKTTDNHSQIYVANADGSDAHNLSRDSLTYDSQPVWSADGKQIAFISARQADTSLTGDLWTMNADGSEPHALYTGGDAASPTWSPDGKQILFLEGSNFLNMVSVDGKRSVVTLASGNRIDITQHAWSSDGRKIIFAKDIGNSVYVMNADGSNATIIKDRQTDDHYWCPSWSPDRHNVAYSHGALGEYRAYTANVDGKKEQEIVTLTIPPDPSSHNLLSSCPIWTSDGQYLLFSSNRDADKSAPKVDNAYPNQFDIYAVNVNSPHVITRLTQNHLLSSGTSFFSYTDFSYTDKR
jgi:Tol biopolymer transport system component